MRITGTGINTGTYIQSIDSSTQITLTDAATATTTGITLTFYRQERMIIYASQSVTVNGTISASGAGARGAMRRWGSDHNGLPGDNGNSGGGGGAGGGGAGGNNTAGSASVAWASLVLNPFGYNNYLGGGGGGGGDNSGTDNISNFGGDAGGVVFIESPNITISATGSIEAKGNIGGTGSATGGSDAGAGGGGGGTIILRAKNYTNSGTLDVSGGTGQAGALSGFAGGNGLTLVEVV